MTKSESNLSLTSQKVDTIQFAVCLDFLPFSDIFLVMVKEQKIPEETKRTLGDNGKDQ